MAGFAIVFTIQLVDDVHKILEGYFYAFRIVLCNLTVHFVDEVQSTYTSSPPFRSTTRFCEDTANTTGNIK